jgi:hypothetical protein
MRDTIVTPADVEQRLRELGREYDEAHAKLEQIEHLYADAKGTWDVQSAKTRLAVRARAGDSGKKMTVQEIEDEALVRNQDEYLAFLSADALKNVARANTNRLRVQIDIARSVGTSVRAAMDL